MRNPMAIAPIYQVDARWDSEASVWVATSDDVPGLVTEAADLDLLRQTLHHLLPELLRRNHILAEDFAGTISVNLITQQQDLIQVAA
ncbi:MAG: hypothetical protein RLZZ511_2406 [Cyanobacteriota bacterium]|jgi:Domain of unknown function (DUF1902)